MPLLPENAVALGRIGGPLLSSNLVRSGAFADPADSNLAFENDLLYIDVVNGRIGIKTTGPTENLNILGSFHADTMHVSGTAVEAANLTFSGNSVQNFTDSIYIQPDQLSNPTIVVNRIATDSLDISDKLIQNTVNNGNINLGTNGGEVVFNTSNVDIIGHGGSPGSLHATGDITWDGTIIFGSSNSDNVAFGAEINSDILPDQDVQFNLGLSNYQWNNIVSKNTASENLTISNLVSNDINFLTTQGKCYYVSVANGNDLNTGTLASNAYATIKKALSEAQAGDEVFIFSGTYTEEFPLTVPAGVHVRGTGIRSVTIKPTTLTKDKDAFLLNGESTVSFLTVSGFYYNTTNDTGYAFRFAPGMKVTSRSPYVQYVSVITEEDTDPAGRGALVDGSVADQNSKEASMLFNSVTMITPNSNALMMTNGVRVEWLNCFTYFADKGLYLTSGTDGFAGLGVKFGAELRSIGSANVYGNYGAVADGDDTLGYLIGHNFGYIGSGTDSTNDRGLVIQANEIVAINNGKLYYDSMDHKGDYRIGDIFYVNQETGDVVFNAQTLNFSATGSIAVEGPGGRSYIDAREVTNNNIRIHDNNIDSTIGPVNFSANSGITYLNTDVNVTGSTYITGNTNVKGNVYLGNQTIDTINIVPAITQTLYPKLDGIYDLGSNPATAGKAWDDLYLNLVNVDNVIQVDNQTITTLTTNTDLVLSAPTKSALPTVYASPDYVLATINSSGNIQISSVVTSDFLTNFWNGIQPGDTIVIKTADTVERTFVIKDCGVSSPVPGYYIDVYQGVISSQSITQMYRIPQPDQITVQDDIDITNDLSVTGLSNYANLNLNGNLVQAGSAYRTGDTDQTGNTNITGNLTVSSLVQFQDIKFDANTVTTTVTNSDLVLNPNGTGILSIPNSNVTITQDLDVADTGNIGTLNVTTTTTSDIFRINLGGVYINDNYITTNVTDQNLQLKANGTGKILVPSKNVSIVNDLTVSGDTFLKNTGITGTLGITGDILQTGDVNRTGNTNVTGTYTVSSDAYFQDVNIISNRILTTLGNNNLEFRANGTGIVTVPTNNVKIDFDLTVVGTGDLNALNTYVTNTTTADIFDISDVYITDNYITTLQTDQDLQLKANGTGKILLPNNNTEITGKLTVNDTTYLNSSVSVTGNISQTGDTVYDGDIDKTGSTTLTGTVTVPDDLTTVNFGSVNFTDRFINTTLTNADLTLTAGATKIISVPLNDVTISNNLNVPNGVTYLDSLEVQTSVAADYYDISDVYLNNNYITTLQPDQDLQLKANGTGKVKILNNDVLISNNLTVNGDVDAQALGIKDTIVLGNILHTGNFNRTGILDITGDVTNNGNIDIKGALSYFEVPNLKVQTNEIISTATNADLVLNPSGTVYAVDWVVVATEVLKVAVGRTDGILYSFLSSLPPGELFYYGDINNDAGGPHFGQTSADALVFNKIAAGNPTVTQAQLDWANNVVAPALLANPLLYPTVTPVVANSGVVNINNWLKISYSEITNIKSGASTDSQKSIILSPASGGSVEINSSRALALPVGSESTRTLNTNGEIRFNSAVSLFEGYNNGALQSFYALYDADRNTYITPELTQGVNDNTIRFGINNSVKSTLDSTKMFNANILSDNVSLSTNIIKNNISANDLEIVTTGTGTTNINGVLVDNNAITNQSSGALILETTGTGYVKFSGTSAIVIPTGTDAERRANPEVGEIRQNTDRGYMEVWNGSAWVVAAGSAANATLEEINDIMDLWTIILG
jgi:hypothetical protein